MLSDFYNLVLECDRNTFFKDKHGKRVKGCEMLLGMSYRLHVERQRLTFCIGVCGCG